MARAKEDEDDKKLFTDKNGLGEIRTIFSTTTFAQKGITLYTKTEMVAGLSTTDRRKNLVFDRTKLNAFLEEKKKDLTESCKTSVGQEYREISFSMAIKEDGYDMLAGINAKGEIVSFIIAQLGECNIHPTFWAVNLICSLGLPGSGAFFLSALSYCAKKYAENRRLTEQKVILELARSYKNTSGLLTYLRSGFVKDLTLYYNEAECYATRRPGESAAAYAKRSAKIEEEIRCFCQNTLPMSLSLDEFSYDDLKGFMNKKPVSNDIVSGLDETGMMEAVIRHPFRDLNKDQQDRLKESLEICGQKANDYLEAQKEIIGLNEKGVSDDKIQKVEKLRDKHLLKTKECLSNYPQAYQRIIDTPDSEVKKPMMTRAQAAAAAAAEAEARRLEQKQAADKARSKQAISQAKEEARYASPSRRRPDDEKDESMPSARNGGSRTPYRSMSPRLGMLSTLPVTYSGMCSPRRSPRTYSGMCSASPRRSPRTYYGYSRRSKW